MVGGPFFLYQASCGCTQKRQGGSLRGGPGKERDREFRKMLGMARARVWEQVELYAVC